MEVAVARKYPEVPEMRIKRLEVSVAYLSQVSVDHRADIADVKRVQAEHSATLSEHGSDLAIIKKTLAEHTIRFDVLEDTMNARFDQLEELIRSVLHWEPRG